ncbi:hypothetical protein [Candidatus Berkiella aquae]|uniref:Uncharacterized protein n=1 Tax=Candidatus Berkiella aquae TaxID=295108 RepID=A0A0Q9YZW4_9GAMM|nr:hypothetical protein [Candidatus Berkiella aquae]MCS5710524.1 hypothetical protein [Candidatus Berkiella aquae]
MASGKKVNHIIVSTSTQYNNCGVHLLVPHLLDFLSDNEEKMKAIRFNHEPTPGQIKRFKGSKGYQYLEEAFAEYYKLTPGKSPYACLSDLIEKYAHPVDLEVLLGPVLRLTLKRVLLNSKEHKDNLKPSFQVIVNRCAQEYRSEYPRMKSKQHLESWIAQLEWDPANEHEELFVPNKQLIANIIHFNKTNKMNTYWDEAYQHYCEYQGDPTQCVYISESQLSLLCASMLFDFRYLLTNEQLSEKSVPLTLPIGRVIAKNATGNHWELVASLESSWQLAREKEGAVFAHYHQMSIGLRAQPEIANQVTILLQNAFRDKIADFVNHGKPYQEDYYRVLHANNWANNSAFSGVVDIIGEEVINNTKPAFLKTVGFRAFLNHFRDYYQLDVSLSKEQLLAKLKMLLRHYRTVQDQFMILSPVLRKVLTENGAGLEDIQAQSLKTLCHRLNIGLEFYVMDSDKLVAGFGKAVENQHRNPIFTLSMTFENEQWHQVEKDELIYLHKSALRQYSPFSAFKTESSSQVLQQGLSEFLINGIPFVNMVSSKVTSKYLPPIVDGLPKQWTALHKAVYENNIERAAELLKQGKDWRIKANREITIKTGLTAFMTEMTVLQVAAYQDNRAMLSLILQYADRRDIDLVQQAYDTAICFNFAQSLYSFLCYQPLTFSEDALQVAIAHKDMVLLQAILSQDGLNNQETSALSKALTLSMSAGSNSDYVLAVQRMLLHCVFQSKVKRYEKAESFQLSEAEMNVIARCLEQNKPALINNLISYYEQLPTLFKTSIDLKKVSQENIRQLIMLLAQKACIAIENEDDQQLENCFIASQYCLQVSGETSPLHYALANDKYHFLESTFEDFAVDALQQKCDKPLSHTQRTRIQAHAMAFLTECGFVHDKFGRTFEYHLDRMHYRDSLDIRLSRSDSWLDTMQIYTAIGAHKANSARIYCVDRFHQKQMYTHQVQQNRIYSWGHVSFALGRMAGLVYVSVPLCALNVGWYFGQDYIKRPLFSLLGKIGASTAPMIGVDAKTGKEFLPSAVNEIISIGLMPEYYLLSGAMSAGIYGISDYIPHENDRALLHLVSDALAQSWVTGTESNYEIDERYCHHVHNNLQAVVGESAASWLTPVVATVDSISMKGNKLANYPIERLTSYISPSVLSAIKENPIFSTLRTAHNVISYLPLKLNELQHQGISVLEKGILNQMEDSVFKNERLHALQVIEWSEAGERLEELTESLEQAKNEGKSASIIDKRQHAVDKQKTLVDTAYEKEQELFKLTEGYTYHEQWQEKYMELKFAEYDVSKSAQARAALKQEVDAAWEKSRFYNSDIANQRAQYWSDETDNLFEECKGNFLDVTNLANVIRNIIDNAYINGAGNEEQIAKYCADEIIRYRYSFYPKFGNKAQIESERQTYYDQIYYNELANSKRAKGRLYEYILAKLTDSQKKKHVPRYKRILKPFINEIFGKTIGWVPFKDFKGGRGTPGSVGLQLNKQTGQATQVSVNVAGYNVYNLRGAEKVLRPEFKLPELKQQSQTISKSQGCNTAVPVISSCTSQGETVLDLDNPFVQGVLLEQLEKLLDSTKETDEAKVKTKKKGQPAETRKQSQDRREVIQDLLSKSPLKPNLAALGGLGDQLLAKQSTSQSTVKVSTPKNSKIKNLLKLLGIGDAQAAAPLATGIMSAPIAEAGVIREAHRNIEVQLNELMAEYTASDEGVKPTPSGFAGDWALRLFILNKLLQPYSGQNPNETVSELDSTTFPVVSSRGSKTETLVTQPGEKITSYTSPLLITRIFDYIYRRDDIKGKVGIYDHDYPKHKPCAKGPGAFWNNASVNPIPNAEVGQFLLDTSYVSPKNENVRFNYYDDKIIKFRTSNDGKWHSYEISKSIISEVGDNILKQFERDKLIDAKRRRQLLKM